MQSLQVSAADELDSLDDRHGSIGRLMRNPKIMWIVIVLLAVLLILVIGLWAWTANHQVQIDNNEPCPTDGVGGLFENLFQDWVANVALYLIHGRYTCSATSAAFYAEELRLTAHTFAGALHYYNNAPFDETLYTIGNWTLPVLQLVDHTQACPCSPSSTFPFASCDSPEAAKISLAQLDTASDKFVQYLVATRQPAYDYDTIRARLGDLNSASLLFSQAARADGITQVGSFYDVLGNAIDAAGYVGMLIDWKDTPEAKDVPQTASGC